ncbi:MAG TPA: hypothetical protein VL633_04045 [Bacteroidota bacterium]|nr:hypothetical protein [Bacteroidota bacterium]
MTTKYLIFIAVGCILTAGSAPAQTPKPVPQPKTVNVTHHDSTLVFGQVIPSSSTMSEGTLYNTLGIDIMVSTNGFGLGTFYRHEYSDELAGFVDFSISESKDDDEKEFVNAYTGQTFVPGKVNRFLMFPLFVGLQKRMFKDDILDNFRPYITAAAGPTMIYVFPYDEEYFSALGRGRPHYTVGGYFGIGAHFGSERSSILGLNLRYYYIPYPGGLESMQGVDKTQFGGFYISLSYGGAL